MKALLTAAAAAAMITGGAQAATSTVYATHVDWQNNGTVATSGDRDDATNALGAPDGEFLSLGLSDLAGENPGFAVFAFDDLTFGAGSTATTYEITFNCTMTASGACTYPEQAELYYGTDYDFGSHDFADVMDDFTLAGVINNGDAQDGRSLLIEGSFTYLALVDTSLALGQRSTDGFDVDAIGVSPVPLPGAAAFFVPAAIAAGVARRKAKKA